MIYNLTYLNPKPSGGSHEKEFLEGANIQGSRQILFSLQLFWIANEIFKIFINFSFIPYKSKSEEGAAMIGAFIAKKKVSSAFNALNRRDLPTFLSGWRDDCVFIYPGDISVSGKVEGKDSIENWFKSFIDQFPKIKFTLKNICVENIFDFVGTNVVTAHWDINLTNRNGKEIQNSGISVINIRFGKALLVIDYIFDTGDKFKTAWGVI